MVKLKPFKTNLCIVLKTIIILKYKYIWMLYYSVCILYVYTYIIQAYYR